MAGTALSSRGLLRVVPPDGLAQQDRDVATQRQAIATGPAPAALTNLASHIRQRFSAFQRHRASSTGWNSRLIDAMNVFNGKYSTEKLAEIKKFGGSDVYARLIAVKCRGATSLLREVYLGKDRPWEIQPTPDPSLPIDLISQVMQTVQAEVGNLSANGAPPSDDVIKARLDGLMQAARVAVQQKAKLQAKLATTKVDDILTEGKFYEALAEFLVDLPLFPFAAVKGPIVRVVPVLKWVQGQPKVVETPKMFWQRVAPADLWWSPGVARIEDAEVLERVPLTRADLNGVLGLPGYDEAAVRAVLNENSDGLRDWIDGIDQERANQESRESPSMNSTGIIDSLEYHGPVQGKMLIEWGFDAAKVPDPDRDYAVQAWLIDRHVIKVQFAPSPRKRHPYYITSFEKVPGTPVGNALPDILADIGDVANAAFRALVNNLSISSGPQVVVNDDRLAGQEGGDEMYPWKRWHVVNDALLGGSRSAADEPIKFFQPVSNSQALLTVYKEMGQIADEISAIPRYTTGSERTSGAGRTSSGLAMLMGNAQKILQTVAANIDGDVVAPSLDGLYDMIMLTDGGKLLTGDESIVVKGVAVAIQKETERQRALEWLQITANPVDQQIVGPVHRARALSYVADTNGMEGENLVPDEGELQQRMAQEAQAQAEADGTDQPPPPGGPVPAQPRGHAPPPKPSAIQVPQTNLHRRMS